MASRHYFTGFSTVDSEMTRQRTYHDVELIKRDLMNHFHTRIGERVMRPDWGCGIWDYLMEPMTNGVRERITEEALNVCKADSRVSVVDLNVIELDHGIRIEITVDYRPLGVVDTFTVDFERRESTRWDGGF